MLWTTAQVHFNDGILIVQRYGDEILRAISVPFIQKQLLLLQMILMEILDSRCKDLYIIPRSWKLLSLAWPAHSPDMSPIERVLGGSRSLYTTTCSSFYQYPKFHTARRRRTATFHRPQSTAWSTLWKTCCTVWGNGGHSRYWLLFWPPQTHPKKSKLVQCLFYCGHTKAHQCNYSRCLISILI